MIHARHQHVRFLWNSRALQFELRVICWGVFLSNEYRAPAEENNKLSDWILGYSLYCASIIQFLVDYQLVKSKNFIKLPYVFIGETCSKTENHNAGLNKHHIITAQTFNDPSCVVSRPKGNSCSTINRSTNWEN